MSVTGKSTFEGREIVHIATANTAAGLVGKLLVASIMKPRIQVSPIESDERTVHRGTTHMAPIATKRVEGFGDPLVIQMDAFQSHKFRQGLLGADVIVPAGAESVFYPCFVPERSETLDAYRMLLIAVARVADPTGRERYLISRMPSPDNSIAITVEGTLMKLSLRDNERLLTADTNAPISVPVRISRSAKMTASVLLEAFWESDQSKPLLARDVGPGDSEVTFEIPQEANPQNGKTKALIIRGTALHKAAVPELDDASAATPMRREMRENLKSGYLPVTAELRVAVEFSTAELDVASPGR